MGRTGLSRKDKNLRLLITNLILKHWLVTDYLEPHTGLHDDYSGGESEGILLHLARSRHFFPFEFL